MINSDLFELFTQDNVNKQAKIEYSGGVMTNEELFQNSEHLTESLCSENELRFGCCEASCFKFKVANIMKPLMGEQIRFCIVVGHREDSPLVIGTYKVQSDTLTADRRQREVVAYDAMYDIINADVADWYNSALPEKTSTMTLKRFRESFVRYFGLTEVVPDGGLANDKMVVERTIEPEQISGKDVITAICEINGCFGHIGRDGKFHYIYLPQAIEGLYPSDDLFPDHAPEWMAQAKTGHLYPQDPRSTKIGTGTKIRCEYESFRTKPITKLQIRKEENDIGRVWPDGDIEEKDNCYIIQDNFLVYGKSHEQLGEIAKNIFSKITDIIYRPFNAYCAGNPCFEVGDAVRLTTKYDIVESYILKRTMKGIQALRDTYEASGAEKYNEKVNGVHKSIIQLKGKANILTRTLEETKIEMYDIAEGLNNTITITARDIRAELKNTKENLESSINLTASQLRTELKNTKDGLESSITQTASQIRTEVKAADDALSSTITQTAGQIRTEVANSDANLQSQITQNAGDIALRVTKDGVVSAINLSPEAVTIQAGRIDLQGLVNAQELTTKFATIATLNATTAELNNLIAQRATISQLDASNARIGSLEVDHVSISDFNSVNARIDNLDANKINASTVYADFMEVSNWTTAGHIKADRIDANTIVSKIGEFSGLINVSRLFVTEAQDAHLIRTSVLQLGIGGGTQLTTSCHWSTITVGKNSYTVLCE